jgi:RNA polymerase sigma-70 factor (ECF subfamily)
LESKKLIELCLLGKQEGYRLLYNRYVTAMARTCYRYLPNPAEAEDALTEGFLKVFAGLKKFEYRDEATFEAWIRRIMIHECLMEIRKRKMITPLELVQDQLLVADADADLNAEEVFNLVQQLPDGYRTVFNLFIIDGYSHHEIAGFLGISESASRSQLAHAREKLKSLLKAYGWK